MKEAYQQGYYAGASDDSKYDNPYCQKSQPVKFFAWLAGWNDYDLGYDLDLEQFEEPTKRAERMIKSGMSHEKIQELTGCVPSTITRIAKRVGLSRNNRQLKTTEINLLMSDKPIWEIAFKLGMSREQVSQHRYKQKQRTLKQNLENLKL